MHCPDAGDLTFVVPVFCRLIPKLQALIKDDNFTGKLVVEDMGLTSTALVKTIQALQDSGFDT